MEEDSFVGDIVESYGRGLNPALQVFVRSNTGQMRRLSATSKIRGAEVPKWCETDDESMILARSYGSGCGTR